MRLALDSSALARRYFIEPGTERVAVCCREAEDIILSALVLPELISACSRCLREGRISSRGYGRLKRDIHADLAQSGLVGLTPEVLEKAVFCLERAALRASDAVHVATALLAAPDLFLTADRRQGRAARELGLPVEVIGP